MNRKWRNGFQRVPVDRWKAGIVFGDAMMRMDPMLVVKRPNSGTPFPPFITGFRFLLKCQFVLELVGSGVEE